MYNTKVWKSHTKFYNFDYIKIVYHNMINCSSILL